jgi:hypothetical protein
MHKKKIVLGAAFAVMSSLMVAGPASAAHCFEGDSPGFSYFGKEGRNKDVPSPGASTCGPSQNGADPSPSERAPGQNR